MEAAGIEPASASAPSVRFYERSSRFGFALRCGPGRRSGASPLNVPRMPWARTCEVSPLNETGIRVVDYPGRSGLLVKQQPPYHPRCWRVCLVAGVLRVSSKLGSSHWTLSAPVEAGTPPCTMHILPFCGGSSIEHGAPGGLRQRRRRSFTARSISRSAVLRAISRRLSYCFLRLATAISSFMFPLFV